MAIVTPKTPQSAFWPSLLLGCLAAGGSVGMLALWIDGLVGGLIQWLLLAVLVVVPLAITSVVFVWWERSAVSRATMATVSFGWLAISLGQWSRIMAGLSTPEANAATGLALLGALLAVVIACSVVAGLAWFLASSGD